MSDIGASAPFARCIHPPAPLQAPSRDRGSGQGDHVAGSEAVDRGLFHRRGRTKFAQLPNQLGISAFKLIGALVCRQRTLQKACVLPRHCKADLLSPAGPSPLHRARTRRDGRERPRPPNTIMRKAHGKRPVIVRQRRFGTLPRIMKGRPAPHLEQGSNVPRACRA